MNPLDLPIWGEFVEVPVVTAKYFAIIRDITGTKEDQINLPPGSTVRDVLARLIEVFGPGLRSCLFWEDGPFREDMKVLLNAAPLDPHTFDKKLVSDGDVLVIMPPIAGG